MNKTANGSVKPTLAKTSFGSKHGGLRAGSKAGT